MRARLRLHRRFDLTIRTLIVATMVSLLVAFAGLACGGDDDGTDGNGLAPSTTEQPGGGDDLPDIGFGPVGNGGSGTITIGDETFPYEVIVCILEDDGGATAAGYGELPDGTPYIAKAEREGGQTGRINAGLDVGVEHISLRGDPEWSTDEIIDPVVETNGTLSFTFDALFRDRALDNFEQVEGSVQVTCEP